MQPLDLRLPLDSCYHAHPRLGGSLCAADVMLKQLRMCWLADHLHTMTMVREVQSLRNSWKGHCQCSIAFMYQGTAIDQARMTSSWRPQKCTLMWTGASCAESWEPCHGPELTLCTTRRASACKWKHTNVQTSASMREQIAAPCFWSLERKGYGAGQIVCYISSHLCFS